MPATGRIRDGQGGRVGANPTLPRLSGGRVTQMDAETTAASGFGDDHTGDQFGVGEYGDRLDDQYDEARGLLDDARRRVREAPAHVVISNHVMGLYELAAIHLSDAEPDLTQARLAIDAVGCLVEGLGDRLGDDAPVLAESLSTLRLAYVQVSARTN